MALLTYPDGSIAKIAYVTTGDPRYPKEVLEAFGDGKVARMDNFKRTELWRGGKCRTMRAAAVDKGQRRELEAFVQAVKTGAEMPVALDSLVATTACTLAVGRSIASGKTETVAGLGLRGGPDDDRRHRPSGNASRAVNLSWYARRLARMSPAEMQGRLADAWLKRRWRARQRRKGEADPLPLPASVPAFASGARPRRGRCAPRRGQGAAVAGCRCRACRPVPLLRPRARRPVERSRLVPRPEDRPARARFGLMRSTSTVAMSDRSARSNMSGSRRGTTSSPFSPPPIS